MQKATAYFDKLRQIGYNQKVKWEDMVKIFLYLPFYIQKKRK